MTESRQENKALPFVGGVLIGAVVAALFSPRSGEDMRKDVKEKAKEVKSKFEDKKEELNKKKEKVADKAEDKIEEGKSKVEQASQSKNNRGSNL